MPRRADGTLVAMEAWRSPLPGESPARSPRAERRTASGFEGSADRPEAGYAVLVPAVDADGNDDRRRAGADGRGAARHLHRLEPARARLRPRRHARVRRQHDRFPGDRDEVAATGDPRRPILERYGRGDGYVARIRAAAETLIAEGFMLEEDLEPTLALAGDWGRPRHDLSLPAE